MRTAPAVSLVLAALVLWSAPAYSQVIVNSCNSTTTCVKEGGDCTAPTAANSFVVCATGSYCSSNRCVRQPRLGDTCVATLPCFDEQYPGAVACRGGTCKYSQIYLPGESCNTGSNYDNGGCVYGSCGTDNKCTSIARNGNCTNAEDLCAPGLYCDDTGACSSRLAQGSACSSNQACDYTLICSSRGATAQPTCVAPFQQSASQGCSYDLDCKAGLRCNSGVCTSPPAAPSGNCANNQLCGTTSFCVCDSKSKDNTETESGTGQCVAFTGLSSSLVNQLQSFQSCAKSKSCQDIWAFSNAFDSFTDLPRGPNQCTASCSRNLIFDSSVKAGTCFSSAATALIVPALLAMLAAVMALLML